MEGSEIEVRVDGASLGLLIGPGGRTLLAIQDLARVAAQRRLGDHDTRLRVDVAGYREKRRVALERFAATVAEQVKESGRRPLARSDAVGRPQGAPRRAGRDRRGEQPVGGRGSQPPRGRRPRPDPAMAPTPALLDALASSQRLGMLGDRPIADVVDHAGAFVAALAASRGTVVDLGTGGGVPGLVIASARPDLRLVLVDRRATRTDHLGRLVRRLGLADRVEVVTADAAALALPLPPR